MTAPIESPTTGPPISAGRRTSLARGFAWAIPLGVCGFCIPFAVLGAVTLLEFAFAEMTPLERADEFHVVLLGAVTSGIACSLVFASSALANFSPRRGIGFVRSLLVMATFMLPWLILAIAIIIVDGVDRGHAPVDDLLYRWLAWAAFIMIYLTGAAAFTYWQIHRCKP